MPSFCPQPLLPFLFILSSLLVLEVSASTTPCLPDHHDSLLKLKQGFTFPNDSKVESWVPRTDCCEWPGVTCDAESGQVTAIDISYSSINGHVDRALFNLTSLKSLNLAGNELHRQHIPSPGFERLQNLTSLNLSATGFIGQIPSEISLLSNLVSLAISNVVYPHPLKLERPDFATLLQNLSKLEVLHLERVNISMKGSEWCSFLSSSVPKLRVLVLRDCLLSGPIDTSPCQLRSLTQLDLSVNHFTSEIPLVMENLPSLTTLRLTDCDLRSIPESILHLEELVSLDLSYNPRLSGELPETKGNLNSLKELHLSGCNLSGPLPEFIFRLQNLVSLDLSDNFMLSGQLPESIGYLKSLKRLKLSWCNFTGLLPASIGELQQLTLLDLSLNSLSGPIPFSLGKLQKLTFLDLHNNSLTGTVPMSLFNLPLLTTLLLSCNQLSDHPDELPSSSSLLDTVDLSHNQFQGPIPSLYGKLQNLTTLYLHDNSFTGDVPFSLFSHPSLRNMLLGRNQLSGHLEVPFHGSSILEYIDLSYNKLHGPIPQSLVKMSNLAVLSLASNNFSGTVDLSSFRNLLNLNDLDISSNNLSVEIKENSLFPLLRRLSLSSCNITKFPELFRIQSRIHDLDLSRNRIHGLIPSWIWQKTAGYLDLSDNLLIGMEIPVPYLLNNYFTSIDLHSNKLTGPQIFLPPLCQTIKYSYNNFGSSIPSNIGFYLNFTESILFSNSNLTGEIPTSICNGLNLRILDLSYNSLSGAIPFCLATLGSLNYLNLRGNMFIGIVPPNFNMGCNLRTINLNGNLLQGYLPPTLVSCKHLVALDVGNNKIDGPFPHWSCELPKLRVLVLRNNMFSGSLPSKWTGSFQKLQIFDISSNHFTGRLPLELFRKWKERMLLGETSVSPPVLGSQFFNIGTFYSQDFVMVRSKGLDMKMEMIFKIFASLDFSSNTFDGYIPEEVGELKWLHVLNMSNNNLSGRIPQSFRKLKNLESMDLSWNKLSGKIPVELAELTFLSFLNLSHNLLVGRIPSSKQFDTFSNDSFLDNPGLCGTPLSEKCGDPSAEPTSMASNLRSEINWNLISIEIGFMLGFGLAVGPLLFWGKGRRWFYSFLIQLLYRYYF